MLLEKVKKALEAGQPARSVPLTAEEVRRANGPGGGGQAGRSTLRHGHSLREALFIYPTAPLSWRDSLLPHAPLSAPRPVPLSLLGRPPSCLGCAC